MRRAAWLGGLPVVRQLTDPASPLSRRVLRRTTGPAGPGGATLIRRGFRPREPALRENVAQNRRRARLAEGGNP